MDNFEKAVEEFRCVYQNISNVSTKNNDPNMFGAAPAAMRGLIGLHYVPVVIGRVCLRSLSIAFGAICGGVSILLDFGMMAFSIHNMVKGNKSAVTDELNKTVHELKLNRTRLHTWEYGNEKDTITNN